MGGMVVTESLSLADTGIMALIFGGIMGLFEFLKAIWPSKNGKNFIVDCPNKIHTIDGTLAKMTDLLVKLEEQHRPVDGIELWKRRQLEAGLLESIDSKMDQFIAGQERQYKVLGELRSAMMKEPPGEALK